jgi:putative ABC transport system permease protein
MSFVAAMAWRDTRASRRRLLFFSLSIVLGIAALVAIGSFGDNLRQAVNDQANGLLGADLLLFLRGEPEPGLSQVVAGLKAERARERDSGGLLGFPATGAEPRPVQVRALEGNFPFYGSFVTEPAGAVARLRQGGAVAIVDAALLEEAGARVGEEVRLGQQSYTVVGALKEFPGEPQVLTEMVPPMLVPLGALPPQNSGPSLSTRLYLKLPPGADAAAAERELRRGRWPSLVNLISADERKRDVAAAVSAIDQFCCLVGFVALFLGSIGLASTIHAYVSQKLNTVAVLRCLGASAGQAFAVYLLQGSALGLVGAVFGAALGVGIQLALPALVQDFIPFPIFAALSWPPVFTGLIAGLSICLLFTLLPLLAIRRVPPLAALRAAVSQLPSPARDPLRVVLGVVIGAAVLGFAHWETRSWPFALGYAGMLAFSLATLTGTARLVSALARRWLPAALPYVARQGIANLYRPNNRTTLLLVSLGLGTFLVLTLYLTRSSFLYVFSNDALPNLVLSGVPEEQADAVGRVVRERGGKLLAALPVIAIKAVTINGRPAAAAAAGERSPHGGRRQAGEPPLEVSATYREALPEGEEVAAGRFTGRVEPGAALIPISIGPRAPWSLKLGDEVVWDVQGVPLRTRVGSLRKAGAARLSLTQDFPVIFPAGALEGAPKTFLLAVRAPDPAASKAIRHAVAASYPSVAVLDVAVVVAAFEKVFRKVAFVVEFMALFTVATGAIMLAAAVVTGRYQRVRETVLLRTLGASRRQLGQIQFFEYAVLGVLAAIVGSLLAVGSNALLAHFVFKFPVHFAAREVGAALLAVPLITLVTGALADRGTARRPPLEVLRQEA